MSGLAELYTRYKGLALALGAGLLLDGDGDRSRGDGLGPETLRLASDAGRVRETDGSRAAAACHEAALALHSLAVTALDAPGHPGLVREVRATHQALRAQLWDIVADQYTPCGAHREHPTRPEHAHG